MLLGKKQPSAKSSLILNGNLSNNMFKEVSIIKKKRLELLQVNRQIMILVEASTDFSRYEAEL